MGAVLAALLASWLAIPGFDLERACIAEEPVARAEVKPFCSFLPQYLCLKMPYCEKPAPPVPCWHTPSVCDHYCRKPIPCVASPCLRYYCDDYHRKPAPCPIPSPVCPPCHHGRK